MSLKRQKRRRALSMTSLIDVIFLLLLFFMLSSTFSRFAEVELSAGGGQGAAGATSGELLFLRLTESATTLNGAPISAQALQARLESYAEGTLLVSVTSEATAQALTDVLVIAKAAPGLTVTVLEGS
ncbi:MAG: biopolymer transporter ExbD [Pseudomonadota bacterium]